MAVFTLGAGFALCVAMLVDGATVPVDIDGSAHGESEGAAEGATFEVEDVGGALELSLAVEVITEGGPAGETGDQQQELSEAGGRDVHG